MSDLSKQKLICYGLSIVAFILYVSVFSAIFNDYDSPQEFLRNIANQPSELSS